ncbi:sensor histidine kinase [Leucobacter zeae]|nr:sensor histidine kinase [Leucobacter zeae]
MGLVNSPLHGRRSGIDVAGADPVAGPLAGSAAGTARAMEIGQIAIAALLTTIGAIRAIGDGTPVAAAVLAAAAILAWHVSGSLLLRRRGARRAVIGWLLGLALVWIGAVIVSPEFVWVAFLLWLLAGHLLPLGWGLLCSACVLVVVIAAPVAHHGGTSYANVFGPLIGGVFAFGISRGYLQLLRDAVERERLVASLTRAQREMAELQDELALAQRAAGAVAERTRISRDIHDTVAQGLSSIRLLAHAGAGRTADPEAGRALGQVEALAGDSLVDVRRIIAALAPAELEGGALAAALRRMLDRAHDEAGLRGELHVDEALPALATETEVALLRTAQSALANVRLHARASRVVMSLTGADRSVRLDIADDGVGFAAAGAGADDGVGFAVAGAGFVTADPAAEAAPGSAGYGLRFMRSRLRELGGGIDIESAPGEGTVVSVHLPILTPSRPEEAS